MPVVIMDKMKKKLETKETKFKEAIEAISTENAQLTEERDKLQKEVEDLKAESQSNDRLQEKLEEKESELSLI